ncbi:hypothetical protein M378DRAFT_93083, partial [Amanita muscaria Koide BX008]
MPANEITLFAKFEQDNPSKLPTLTEGKITPQTLYRFEKGCQRYFLIKNVAGDAEKIVRTTAGIRDPAIMAWAESNNLRFATLPFADFLKELRERALDTDWETDIRREMALSKYSLNTDFQNWADNIIFLNCLLHDSTKKYDEKGLLELLQTNLDADLDREVRAPRSQIRSDTIKHWIEDVRRLAETARRDIKRLREFAEEAHQRSAKRQSATSVSKGSRPFSNMTNVVAQQPWAPGAGMQKLTWEERDLLREHEGCYKCREFYVEHVSSTCPTGFPDARTYVPLTKAMAMEAKRKKEARGGRATGSTLPTAGTSSRASSSRVAAIVSRSP